VYGDDDCSAAIGKVDDNVVHTVEVASVHAESVDSWLVCVEGERRERERSTASSKACQVGGRGQKVSGDSSEVDWRGSMY